jgi:putative nucleotidyltransferase with HDIG domain
MSLQRILRRMESLPTLPAAVSRLYGLLQDPSSSASDFERVIRPDAALTANLLRMANSPFFGLPRKVTEIRLAITLLGVKRVFEAATSASFLRLIPTRLAGYEIEAKAFWQHCAAVAIIGERLATELKLRAPDMIFTAGLLHDIGKLAVSSFLLEEPREMRARFGSKSDESYLDIERETLGTDHTEIGAAVAERWGLPPMMGAAARWHHTPSEIPDQALRPAVDLVHVADGLAHILGHGADAGELQRRIDAQVLDRLGVKVQRLEHVASETLEQINGLGELFAARGA